MPGGDPRRQEGVRSKRPVSPEAEALAGWLNEWPWDLFGHVTFGGMAPKEDYASREFIRHFLWPVNRELYGSRWAKRDEGILVARAWEFGGRGGRGHFHFLASSGAGRELASVRRETLWGRWFSEVGQARFEPYDASRGARYYLGKVYVAKGGAIDCLGPSWKWEASRGMGTRQQVILPR
jgi:hypothetical protein